jgi:hypothetical protein
MSNLLSEEDKKFIVDNQYKMNIRVISVQLNIPYNTVYDYYISQNKGYQLANEFLDNIFNQIKEYDYKEIHNAQINIFYDKYLMNNNILGWYGWLSFYYKKDKYDTKLVSTIQVNIEDISIMDAIEFMDNIRYLFKKRIDKLNNE